MAINGWCGRADIPIGTDKVGPTYPQRTSHNTPGLCDAFTPDARPDDRSADTLNVYLLVSSSLLGSRVTSCSIGGLSNLAVLCRTPPLRCAQGRR